MTAEGRFVVAILDRYGIWKRAGMDGMLCGLDVNEALASLPDELDRGFAARLLAIAEIHYIASLRKHMDASNGQ